MTALALIVKYWYAVVIAALLVVILGMHIAADQRDATIASLKAANATAEAQAKADHTVMQTRVDAVTENFNAQKAANDQLAADIRDRVLQYETRAAATAAAAASQANAASGVIARLVATVKAPTQPESAPAADTTASLIADAVGACYRDDVRFEALQDWVRALTAPVPR